MMRQQLADGSARCARHATTLLLASCPNLRIFLLVFRQVCGHPLGPHHAEHQPQVAQEMMGPLYGQPLLQPHQVLELTVKVILCLAPSNC
jgi:hypothetical protein